MVGHSPERLFHLLLNTSHARLLALPAAISCASVLDTGSNPGNNSGRLRGGRFNV
ncbi:hypothetical protein GCM10007418_29670 [Halopseudomonas salina]|uniref:Uncharacterized protein n=1 Tax=Halopseudomonas salina TaxID=1323744 RepID=A0ABQ1Q0A1_9GAMM|nr:hypothetical protein GCM10007418_29670 [Halopseudomonas salina]